MKKTKLITILTVLGGIVLASSVFAAATISFSPVSVDVVQGENFDLVVAINPQGVESYTTKVELEYPSDLLEVKSFNFGSNWMALSASGYDLIDNTNGILIKTAGYPGGLSSAVTFGTVSFSAKKSGSGVIGLGNNSMVLDATNQDILSGATVQSVIGISALAPTSPTPTAQAPLVETPKAETSVPSEEAGEIEEAEGTEAEVEAPETEDGDIEELDEQITDSSEEDAQSGLLAGIVGLGSSVGGWLIIIAIILLLAFVLIVIRKKRRGR